MSHTRSSLTAFGIALAIAAGALVLPANGQTSEDSTTRIMRLEKAVLAPCCYTEAVATHQSEIALKMRIEIARWVAEGRTDDEILGTYVARYGSKVLVDPRTTPAWWTPWIPWMALILASGFGLWRVRHWQTHALPAPMPASGPELPALPDFDEEDEWRKQ